MGLFRGFFFFVLYRRLAKTLPLPVENEESRPRIDLVVFIIHLSSELRYPYNKSFAVNGKSLYSTAVRIYRVLKATVSTCALFSGKHTFVYFVVLSCSSLQSAEASLKHLDSGYFLGKVCFMATNGTEKAFGSSMKHINCTVAQKWGRCFQLLL